MIKAKRQVGIQNIKMVMITYSKQLIRMVIL